MVAWIQPFKNYCLFELGHPVYPGRWYFEYFYESKTLPDHRRIDKGSEATAMPTKQAFS